MPSPPLPSPYRPPPAGGPPALHVQTQPPPPVEQQQQQQPQQPQSGHVPPSASSSVYSVQTRRVASPASDRRISPAPRSAGAGGSPVPSRFPPRKSSMGQQDLADLADAQPRSGSRPGSSHRPLPWSDAAPPASPAKPLAFVRPADIYKRMEEERERGKERRSMESGRRSTDSAATRGSEPAGEPAKPEPDSSNIAAAAEPAARTSTGSGSGSGISALTRDAPADAATAVPFRGSRPPLLETVAERKSEYGLEGLVSDATPTPRQELPATELSPPPPPPPTQTHPEPAIPTVLEPLQPQHARDSLVSAADQDEVRRFSSSPKLPSLARMSAFGDDLFSNPSRFLSDAPPLPPMHELASPSAPEPEKAAETAPPADTRDAATRSAPMAQQQQQQQPGPSELLPPRPRLPGEWVSETESARGDEAIDAIAAQPPSVERVVSGAGSSVTSRGNLAAGEVSPVSEMMDEHKTAVPSAAGATAGATVDGAPRGISPAPSHRHLPPLRTQSQSPQPQMAAANSLPQGSAPAPLTPQQQQQQQQQEQDPSSAMSPPSASHTPASAASHSVAPIAPLNPRRAYEGSPVSEFVAPQQHLERISTMSTVGTNNSPAKESDKLREEIIRTLSPARSPEELFTTSPPNPARSSELFLGITGGHPPPAAKPTPAASRESTYLQDVYDHYINREEDEAPGMAKRIDEEDEEAEEEEEEKFVVEEAPPPPPSPPAAALDTTELESEAGPVDDPGTRSPLRDGSARPGLVRNRFSWETGPEQVVVTGDDGEEPLPATEPKSLAAEPFPVAAASQQPSPAPADSPAQSPTAAVDSNNGRSLLSPTVLPGEPQQQQQQQQAVPMTHQVSQDSSLPPVSQSGAPEPPSPVSVLSDRNMVTAAAAACRAVVAAAEQQQDPPSRLSLAEEKSLLQSSANPVSPTPPPEQHPALAPSPPPSPPAATSPASPDGGHDPIVPAVHGVREHWRAHREAAGDPREVRQHRPGPGRVARAARERASRARGGHELVPRQHRHRCCQRAASGCWRRQQRQPDGHDADAAHRTAAAAALLPAVPQRELESAGLAVADAAARGQQHAVPAPAAKLGRLPPLGRRPGRG